MSATLHWLSPGDPNQKAGGFLYNLRVIEDTRSAGMEVVLQCRAGDLLFPDEATIEPVALQLQAIREADSWRGASQRTAAPVRHRLGSQPIDAVAIPGCDSAPRSRGACGSRLLCVAAISRREAHAGLLEALASIVHLDWTLDCAGATDREPECPRALQATIEKLGLNECVNMLGGLSGDALDDVSASAAVVVDSGAWLPLGSAVGRLLQDVNCRIAMSNAAHALPAWSDVSVCIGDEVHRMGASR